MRKITLPTPVLAAALGCLALAGCAPQPATTADHTRAGSALTAKNAADDLPAPTDPDIRFITLVGRVIQHCSPGAPSDKGDADTKVDLGRLLPAPGGEAPGPENLPGAEQDTGTPLYGPGRTPPGTPNADGDIPVPLPSDAPEPTGQTSPAGPKPLQEVPLTAADQYAAAEHAKRVREAFTTTPSGFDALRDKLTALDYPASRIHRMPGNAGSLRARIDLRFMGNNLALEITNTTNGVTVEPFGMSEREDVQVTDIQRTQAHTPAS
ncbi:hypothetical protein [Kitasatospora sp. KL5]|uniref:hypothetical protein n=1 Tax=Kitasatospora sp. KL5 TaxID=3425125 RepID=UPI003D6F1B38